MLAKRLFGGEQTVMNYDVVSVCVGGVGVGVGGSWL